MLCGAHHSAQSQMPGPVPSPPSFLPLAAASPRLHRSSSARRMPLALRPALDSTSFLRPRPAPPDPQPVRCEPSRPKDVMPANRGRAGVVCSAWGAARVMRLPPLFLPFSRQSLQWTCSVLSRQSGVLGHLATPNRTYAAVDQPSSPSGRSDSGDGGMSSALFQASPPTSYYLSFCRAYLGRT